MFKIILSIFIVITVSACSIVQTVKPVTNINNKEICIIRDNQVRPGFLNTYLDTLERKGYKITLLPERSAVDSCKITSTYLAKWSWDLAIYMAYAKIKVYRDGRLIGNVLYDSTKGGANMDKFIKGEVKIRELVNKLFP